MSPARGCSCEGSGSAASPRNEETSWALDGSKAVGVKEERSLEAGEDEELVEEGGEDFWPVSVPQRDILMLSSKLRC